jgi:FkbM family methyltransferase
MRQQLKPLARLVRRVAHRFGVDVVRYVPPKTYKTVRTDALTLYETATGRYYLPTDAHADVIANAIKGNLIFEQDVIDTARQHIKPGTAVLDVGANFGQMSILFSEMVGAEGRVYSFDADDFVFDILKKNIKANGREDRITAVYGAVHDVPNQTLHFPVQDFERFGTYGSYGVDYAKGTQGRPVPTLTIDTLEIRQPVSFMKIDIQGGDLQAMQGARATIERNKMPIIFEFEKEFQDEYRLSFQEYVDFVRDIGYRFARVTSCHNYLIVPR